MGRAEEKCRTTVFTIIIGILQKSTRMLKEKAPINGGRNFPIAIDRKKRGLDRNIKSFLEAIS